MKKFIILVVVSLMFSGCTRIERLNNIEGTGAIYHAYYSLIPTDAAIKHIKNNFPNYEKICGSSPDYYIYCKD